MRRPLNPRKHLSAEPSGWITPLTQWSPGEVLKLMGKTGSHNVLRCFWWRYDFFCILIHFEFDACISKPMFRCNFFGVQPSYNIFKKPHRCPKFPFFLVDEKRGVSSGLPWKTTGFYDEGLMIASPRPTEGYVGAPRTRRTKGRRKSARTARHVWK